MNENVRLCYYNFNETFCIGYIEGKKVEKLGYWNGGVDSELVSIKAVTVLVTEYTNGKITRHIMDRDTGEILRVEISE